MLERHYSDDQIVQHVPAAIFFDCDDVFNNPERSDPYDLKSYKIDINGFLEGELIGREGFNKLVQFSIKNSIPLYVVTARPDNKFHRSHIVKLINEVHGFHAGIGGFKEKNIYCLGEEVFDETLQRFHVAYLRKTKLEMIEEIHQKELTFLPKSHILFVDYLPSNIEHVEKAGYTTILAVASNTDHFKKAYSFLEGRLNIPHVTTLGSYAVLVKPEQLRDQPLERTEYLHPTTNKKLEGYFWRKRILPSFSLLADMSRNNRKRKSEIALALSHLKSKQVIFFTDNLELIEKHIIENSYGTVSSLKELAHKENIYLLGSEGKRKSRPLQKVLADYSADPEKVAIIGFPADSGVDLQPVGHEQTLLGCRNRLKQVQCFRDGLKIILNNIIQKPRSINCFSIENGIGLYPVESLSRVGEIKLADFPLSSNNGTQFHFYDQAHILFDNEHQILHQVTKPSMVQYTLTSKNLNELTALFNNAKPTSHYYLIQSHWSWEMVKKLNSDQPENAFPIRRENGKIIPSDNLIQNVLREFLNINLPKKTYTSHTKLFGLGVAAVGLGLSIYGLYKRGNEFHSVIPELFISKPKL